jgi:hypothetical protein
MTSDFGVPEVARAACHDDTVCADLEYRADVLDQLMNSARALRIDNGRVTVEHDAQAWFAAQIAHAALRPTGPTKPLAEWTQAELREFVRRHFESN